VDGAAKGITYQWLGQDSFGTYADIGEWYDSNTTKPTEQECLDEWDVILAERQASASFEADKLQAETDAVTDFAVLPDWVKVWTANDAAAYVHDNVLNGLDAAGVDAYVDGLPNTVAGMKTGLKQIGGALVAIRDILEVIAKLIMYIKDLVISFRNGA